MRVVWLMLTFRACGNTLTFWLDGKKVGEFSAGSPQIAALLGEIAAAVRPE